MMSVDDALWAYRREEGSQRGEHESENGDELSGADKP